MVEFRATPITDIIQWPEKGPEPSTTNAPTSTTTRPASSAAITTPKTQTTTLTTTTPTTTTPTTTTPTTTTPTTTAPTTSTSTISIPTTTIPSTPTLRTTTPTTTTSTTPATTPTITTPTTTTTPTATSATTTTTLPPTTPTTTIGSSTLTSSITTIAPIPSIPPNEIFTACQLAEEISYISGKSVDWDTNLDKWVCLSNVTTKFTNSYIQVSNTDPSIVYYRIFKISNGWCTDPHQSRQNPCNIKCQDLLNNLEGSISCAQHILEENGFHEWPEYEIWCTNIPHNYLAECRRSPGFISTDGPETAKVFNELSQNQQITCSVHGVPPPELTWDQETTAYIDSYSGRLETNQFRERSTDGSWMVQRGLSFTEVVKSDNRGYAQNIVSNKTQEYTVTVVPAPQNSSWTTPTLISTGIALALLIPAVLVLLCHRKRLIKLGKMHDDFKYGRDDETGNNKTKRRLPFLPSEIHRTYQNINALPFPKELEIIPSRLTLNKKHVLGRGEFGIVFMGLLDGITPTAVKTAKDVSDDVKLNALLSEVKVMAYVGSHKNVAQLLGVQLVDLRKEYLVKHSDELGTTVSFDKFQDYIDPPNFVRPLSRYELLRWCHQICGAMEFLGSKKVIHGDLATRNILLDSNCVAKVSDFGLSRQMFHNYKKSVVGSGDTPLPIPWLLIEALRHLRFSIQSDIWAFGVLMWEVFTLGETPYIGINSVPEFIEYLEDGHRLEKPEYATNEM
ncbi:Fibroblast growth factor receptor 3 [Folsomia candida]|uniref:Fibroblast growth factor receptor 3 n=1 Tax=Folsomia candida TaxID=158441 RepID=A0A226DKT8_FOLCA|nr:Fibroblast growth factor receptor 3 [Folsomia candida]